MQNRISGNNIERQTFIPCKQNISKRSSNAIEEVYLREQGIPKDSAMPDDELRVED